MRVPKPVFLVKRFAAAVLIAAAAFVAADTAPAAEGPKLPPAEYKPLPVGTKISYDNKPYSVSRTDGFLTVFKLGKKGGPYPDYLYAYALFGEYGDNIYVYFCARPILYDIDSEDRKKLEALWPLEVGKETIFELQESGMATVSAQTWNIRLKVLKTAVLNLKGYNYSTYLIEERGQSEKGSSFVGRRWYHPSSGLIIQSRRSWTKVVAIPGPGSCPDGKLAHFAEGEEDNSELVEVQFPGDTLPHMVKGTKAGGASDKELLAEVERQKQKAEEARKAQATAEKARLAELARLKQESEKAQQARQAEMARLKQEAEKAEQARAAEVALLKQKAEETWKAIEARKAQEAEAAKAREAEIARLRREAEEARKAGSAGADKARIAEIARLEKEVEQRHWDSVKDSPELAAVEDYLKRYPKGRYVAEAKARVAVLQRLASANKIDFGNYHALVIGINEYKYLPKLQMAVNDAKAVAKVLKESYGFKVTLLLNANHTDIIDAFDDMQDTLIEKDNLLIYYAGHGWLNEDVDRGYWLPANAKPGRRSRWVSNATITDTLKGLNAKHVMLIADSCYSGTLVRAADVGSRKRTGNYWKEMASKWARVAITSGGLEPVADKGGGDNSPFAKAFMDALGDNKAVMDGTTLFSKMRRPVMVAAEQTPQYSDVRNAGHDGGDFLFVRKK